MLAAEANRSMTQPFNMMNNVHMPEVAVIVKLPNIAMKYQMANGQVMNSASQAFFAHHSSSIVAFKSDSRVTRTTMKL